MTDNLLVSWALLATLALGLAGCVWPFFGF